MRLRLSIERHELPVVKILWHVSSDSTTISKLLEQISDVIPLESDGWGFEDYAVQVNGYECLHYLDVRKILNGDDEVSIRALETSDIRARTVSGRHQISAAGAHLIDGIPFGRNYLKRPDRPPIHIPPRKRQRVSYRYEVLNNLSGASDPHSRITSTFDHADMNEGLEGGLRAIEDASRATNDELPESGRLRSGKRRKSVSFDEISLSSAGPQFEIYEDNGVEPIEEKHQKILSDTGSPSVYSKSASVDSTSASVDSTSDSGESDGSIGENIDTIVTPGAGISIDSEDSEQSDSDTSDSDRSVCKSLDSESSDSDASDTPSSSDGSNSSSSTSFDSSEGGAQRLSQRISSNSSSSSQPDSLSSSDGSISDSEVGNDGESLPSNSESSSSGQVGSDSAKNASVPTIASFIPHQIQESTPDMPQCPAVVQTQRAAPGMGKVTTRARNQRRSLMNKIKKLQARGLAIPDSFLSLPTETSALSSEDSSGSRFHAKRQVLLDALADERGSDKSSVINNEPPPPAAEATNEEIIVDTTMTDHPCHTNTNPPNRPIEDDCALDHANQMDILDDMPEETTSRAADVRMEVHVPTAAKPLRRTILDFLKSTSMENNASGSTAQLSEASETRSQRSRINLDGSRRLLFGSLGVRTPKTKEEEESLRLRLSKEATKKSRKVIKETIISDVQLDNPVITEADQVIDDPQAWRSKIKLSAVECCDPLVRYSTPPFPFVQRWDAQQRFDPGVRSKKRKRRSHHYDEYPDLPYDREEEAQMYDEGFMECGDSFDRSTQKVVNTSVEATSQLLQEIVDSSVNSGIGYMDVACTAAGGTHDEQDAESDLPIVPPNIDTLPVLQFSNAHPNICIAFKQLECSEATYYQPMVSAYRTAIINSVLQEDQQLVVTLARRDRIQMVEHRYDEKGNRVLGRFEVHIDETSDEEEDKNDDGKRELYFTDLIDPKILQLRAESMQDLTPKPSTLPTNGEEGDQSSGSLSSQTVMVQDSMIVGHTGDFMVDGEDDGVSSEGQQDSMFTNENLSAVLELGTER